MNGLRRFAENVHGAAPQDRDGLGGVVPCGMHAGAVKMDRVARAQDLALALDLDGDLPGQDKEHLLAPVADRFAPVAWGLVDDDRIELRALELGRNPFIGQIRGIDRIGHPVTLPGDLCGRCLGSDL